MLRRATSEPRQGFVGGWTVIYLRQNVAFGRVERMLADKVFQGYCLVEVDRPKANVIVVAEAEFGLEHVASQHKQ